MTVSDISQLVELNISLYQTFNCIFCFSFFIFIGVNQCFYVLTFKHATTEMFKALCSTIKAKVYEGKSKQCTAKCL